MVSECLHIQAKFPVSSIAESEKFAFFSDQSRMVFTAANAHNSMSARD